MNTEEILEKSRQVVAEIHKTMTVIERCNALAGIIKDMDFVFADPKRNEIVDVYPVLSDIQQQNLKSMIIGSIALNREDAEKQLLKITASDPDLSEDDAPEEDDEDDGGTVETKPVIPDSFQKTGKKPVVLETVKDRNLKILKMWEQGMTQAEIAREVKVSPARISQIIKKHNASPSNSHTGYGEK